MKLNKIQPVSAEAIAEFIKARSELIAEVVNQSMKNDIENEHHGSHANQIITAGMEFTHKMLIASMQAKEPLLLVDQAEWAVDRLPHDGIPVEQIIKNLERLMVVVEEKLPSDHAQEINNYIAYLVNQIKKPKNTKQ